MPRSPSGWICTKFGLGCPPADVINCAEFCCNRLMSFDSVRGQKFAISHWLGQSPLTRCWRYRAACDPLHLPFLPVNYRVVSNLKSEDGVKVSLLRVFYFSSIYRRLNGGQTAVQALARRNASLNSHFLFQLWRLHHSTRYLHAN